MREGDSVPAAVSYGSGAAGVERRGVAASQRRTEAALGRGSDASTNGASKRAQLHTLRKWASSPV